MKRERILTWTVTAIAVLALIFGVAQLKQVQRFKIREEVARQRALFNLISHVENMEGNLSKARVSSTPAQRSTFLTACWSHSQAAQENLSLMGMTTVDLSAVQKFVAQVGDYSMVLSQKLARGDTVTQSEWQTLGECEVQVEDLARALAETGLSAFPGRDSGVKTGLLPRLSAVTSAFDDETWFRGFSEIDSLIQSVPSPAYDGPFSDRALASKPLTNPGPEISSEEAAAKALEFMNIKGQLSNVQVKNIEGAVPAYMVTGERNDGSEISVSLARDGGAVLWGMDRNTREVAELTVDAARQAAEAFLRDKGMDSLIETGWRKPGKEADRVVFVFANTACVQQGPNSVQVVLYPEMVKVEIALDTGSVIGYDATAHLTNGVSSGLKVPLVSAKEAEKVLKSDLKVMGSPRLTVIPLVSGRSVMAWEFRVGEGDDTYLIYINAMTGKEEMVLQMVMDETGTLTM